MLQRLYSINIYSLQKHGFWEPFQIMENKTENKKRNKSVKQKTNENKKDKSIKYNRNITAVKEHSNYSSLAS